MQIDMQLNTRPEMILQKQKIKLSVPTFFAADFAEFTADFPAVVKKFSATCVHLW